MKALTVGPPATAGVARVTEKAEEVIVEHLMFGVIVGQIAVLVFLGTMLWILSK